MDGRRQEPIIQWAPAFGRRAFGGAPPAFITWLSLFRGAVELLNCNLEAKVVDELLELLELACVLALRLHGKQHD
jgi:hypothetical protein